MSKSPATPAREALAVGQRALPAYASKYSRKDHTLPQLFALLMLRRFFRTDNRGVVAIVRECGELQEAFGLDKVPDHSTLWHAERKLLERGFDRLLSATCDRGRECGLIAEESDDRTAAIDSTGLETRHTLVHFKRRCDKGQTTHSDWYFVCLHCDCKGFSDRAAIACGLWAPSGALARLSSPDLRQGGSNWTVDCRGSPQRGQAMSSRTMTSRREFPASDR